MVYSIEILNITAETLLSYFDETPADLADINARQTVSALLRSRFEWESERFVAAGHFMKVVNVWQNGHLYNVRDEKNRKIDDEGLVKLSIEDGAFYQICFMLNKEKETPEFCLTERETAVVQKMLNWASDRTYEETNVAAFDD